MILHQIYIPRILSNLREMYDYFSNLSVWLLAITVVVIDKVLFCADDTEIICLFGKIAKLSRVSWEELN